MTISTFRYTTTGTWYKGNTHLHSTASDGGWTFAELAQAYAGAGYDFLFRTDHWVCSDVAADSDDYPLLWLDGIELDGRDDDRFLLPRCGSGFVQRHCARDGIGRGDAGGA